MRRLRGTILLLVALAVAAALALVGQAVFAVAGDLRSSDLKREPSRSLPSQAASRLIAAGDTITFRQALRLLKQKGGPKAQAVKRRADAETKLERLTRHGTHSTRSEAENLLTVLRLNDALMARGDPSAAISSAIEHFAHASRVDPRNADAKYNLELLLTLRPKNKQTKTTKPVPKQNAAATGHVGTVHNGAGY
jgi:hypothetical protein